MNAKQKAIIGVVAIVSVLALSRLPDLIGNIILTVALSWLLVYQYKMKDTYEWAFTGLVLFGNILLFISYILNTGMFIGVLSWTVSLVGVSGWGWIYIKHQFPELKS